MYLDVIMTSALRLSLRSGSDQRDGRGREEARWRPVGPVSTRYDRALRPDGGSHDIFGRHGQQGRGRGASRPSHSRTTAGQPEGSSVVSQTHTR